LPLSNCKLFRSQGFRLLRRLIEFVFSISLSLAQFFILAFKSRVSQPGFQSLRLESLLCLLIVINLSLQISDGTSKSDYLIFKSLFSFVFVLSFLTCARPF